MIALHVTPYEPPEKTQGKSIDTSLPGKASSLIAVKERGNKESAYIVHHLVIKR